MFKKKIYIYITRILSFRKQTFSKIRLQSMQNCFLRIVYRNADLSTDDMYELIGTGKLRFRRDLHLCGLMYK